MVEKQQLILMYMRQGKSQREIHRQTGVSRKTIRKYLQEYCVQRAKMQQGEDLAVLDPPSYDSSNRSRPKLTESVAALINECLRDNDLKRSKGMSKQLMKATDIHELLRSKGFDIGYTTVCNYVSAQKHGTKEIYIRQQHQPGFAIEFDWAEVKLIIREKLKRIQLAVFTSSCSNYRWACLFYRQDMCSFLQSHVLFFKHLGHVPSQMVYDNMRVAVRKFAIKNADKIATDDLLKLSVYYQFDYRFCNVRKGNEKGHVEKSVEFIRRKAFSRIYEFDDLQQANEHLSQELTRINNRKIKGCQNTIDENMILEQQHMLAAPVPYDAAQYHQLRIDKYQCIKVDTNSYSVPESYTEKFIDVKVYPTYMKLYDSNHNCIATHERQYVKYQYFIKLQHYLATFKTKPGALNQSVALNQSPVWLQQLYVNHFKNRAIDFIEVLTYFKQSGYDQQQLINATQRCTQLSPHSPLSVDKISMVAKSMFETQANTGEQHHNNPNQQTAPLTRQINANCEMQLQLIQQLFK